MSTATAANDGSGGIDIAAIIAAIQAISGTAGTDASKAAGIADPFASQRPQYQADLLKLISDPGSFTMDPGALASEKAALGTVEASNDALGANRSGKMTTGIAQVGADAWNQDYNQRINQLLTLSGATTGSPAAAGAITQQGQMNQNANIAGGINGLTQILQGLGLPASVVAAITSALGGGSGAPGSVTVDPSNTPDLSIFSPGGTQPGDILNAGVTGPE